MITEIVKYTEAADQRIISMFDTTEIDMPEAERLFSHVLNAQHVWLQRISGNVPLYGIWQVHPKIQFADISVANFGQIKSVLSNRDLEEQITYQNSIGDQFQNTIAEILFQLLNHSTYHRAQIATLFKREGLTPPITDYIMFKRNHLL
ncbi:DinB family protein [Pedobacter rhizosphaerae]|uniref:Uncharacterized damage-inducible protein DinB (Forms a four-helix bundle) n=1 Tax=Pedobacter rhizosphaerae TaxID=390241 RepID=A0A1H9UMA7_9SPHI|nr:DinB family protein [Pedobacter rhizosphaerae]SES10492.1 Uncharacterized damage-inducible protein DinB (forms a four-helix bundle) [Pedobacter rhizosphaerae]